VLSLGVLGCGSGSESGSATATQTEAVTSQASDSATTEAAAGPIVVGKPVAIYLQNQVGGKYHTVFAMAKNTSGDDLTVSAQFSFFEGKRLLGTADATTTLLAGQEGVLLAQGADLPKPFRAGTVTVTTDTSEPFMIDDALRNPSAITITAASIKPGAGVWGYCEFRAVVTNKTAEKQSPNITWVGYSKGRPVTADFTFANLFPKTPKVVTDPAISEALCPAGVTKVRAFWSP
jgi:hypothetical protein